jgi:hypothetical protein
MGVGTPSGRPHRRRRETRTYDAAREERARGRSERRGRGNKPERDAPAPPSNRPSSRAASGPASALAPRLGACPVGQRRGESLLEREARSAVWEQGSVVVVLNYAALSFAVAMTLWGAERIVSRDEQCARPRCRLGAGGDRVRRQRAGRRRLGSRRASRRDVVRARGRALAFVWIYAALQLGLDRLGRERLRPDAARVDSTRGLRPLGALAFMGCGCSWRGSFPSS